MADLQPLPSPDPTVNSKNPIVLANLALLATMGAPAAPDGITFIDMDLVSPAGVDPFHATIFHAKVNGVWVEHVALDYLIENFPIVTFNDMLSKGMITVGPGTPTTAVFQTEPSGENPLSLDPPRRVGGIPNPGDFGIPVPPPAPVAPAPAPITHAVPGQNPFGASALPTS